MVRPVGYHGFVADVFRSNLDATGRAYSAGSPITRQWLPQTGGNARNAARLPDVKIFALRWPIRPGRAAKYNPGANGSGRGRPFFGPIQRGHLMSLGLCVDIQQTIPSFGGLLSIRGD
jgi:hypothetical protein